MLSDEQIMSISREYGSRIDFARAVIRAALSEASPPPPAPTLPEIDYEAAIKYAFKKFNWRQGTTGCIAFARGAEWYRASLAVATKDQP